MPTANLASTSSAAPDTIYTGPKRLLRVINNDAVITVHVRDPQVNSNGLWADLAPGADHLLVRDGASRDSVVQAYADSGTPSVTVNEMSA